MKVTGPVWESIAWYFGDVPITCRWETSPDSDDISMVLDIRVESSCTRESFNYARRRVYLDLRERGYTEVCNMLVILRDYEE